MNEEAKKLAEQIKKLKLPKDKVKLDKLTPSKDKPKATTLLNKYN